MVATGTTAQTEKDSLGEVEVPADKLWGAQTQRSLEHFSIGTDLIPREMIGAYATLKKAAAIANHASHRLAEVPFKLIVHVCDEILAGQHRDMFPLHVWMTGSGTQFNMNVNEVISNRCCQLTGRASTRDAFRRSKRDLAPWAGFSNPASIVFPIFPCKMLKSGHNKKKDALY